MRKADVVPILIQRQPHHSIQLIQYNITKIDASAPSKPNKWAHNFITGPGKGSLIYRVATPVVMIGTLSSSRPTRPDEMMPTLHVLNHGEIWVSF